MILHPAGSGVLQPWYLAPSKPAGLLGHPNIRTRQLYFGLACQNTKLMFTACWKASSLAFLLSCGQLQVKNSSGLQQQSLACSPELLLCQNRKLIVFACSEASSLTAWLFYGQVQPENSKTQPTLCSSLHARNAYGHFTRAILREDFQVKLNLHYASRQLGSKHWHLHSQYKAVSRCFKPVKGHGLARVWTFLFYNFYILLCFYILPSLPPMCQSLFLSVKVGAWSECSSWSAAFYL